MHHLPWPLEDAELAIEDNSMGATAGVRLEGAPAVVHFSERLDVLAWGLTRLG